MRPKSCNGEQVGAPSHVDVLVVGEVATVGIVAQLHVVDLELTDRWTWADRTVIQVWSLTQFCSAQLFTIMDHRKNGVFYRHTIKVALFLTVPWDLGT